MPSYLNEVFELAYSNNLRTRNSYLKLICPFPKSNMGQNALFFIGPSTLNKTPEVLRKTNFINTFKNNSKSITYHDLIRQKINYNLIIITVITFMTIITLLTICLLLS